MNSHGRRKLRRYIDHLLADLKRHGETYWELIPGEKNNRWHYGNDTWGDVFRMCRERDKARYIDLFKACKVGEYGTRSFAEFWNEWARNAAEMSMGNKGDQKYGQHKGNIGPK